ncbi:phage tail assembly chaperone [Pigmentiphaga kullae]|uniref:Tail assembly chaperone n=1 Tax=Pigmentiphaga kullae TaxID=151784 RepID=A0A4V2F2Z9_9BURK|nr:phage tail assembly chaperone [Pigmentiphaga kullae]RZS80654.1 tail assembly chaperone [Pigmentiphaga kullae]
MFKLKPAITFVFPVEIPRADGGESTLNLVFNHKTRDELQEFLERAGKTPAGNIDPLLEVVAGWEEVDGEFSAAALKRLTQDFHGADAAILQGYVQALTEGRRGN